MKINYTKMVFRTKRLVVRPLKLSDYEVWLTAYSQRKPKSHKYDMAPIDPKKYPKSLFKKIVKILHKKAKEDKYYAFSAFLKTTGQHVGSVDIATLGRNPFNWANLGCYIHNTFQRNGYGSELAKEALDIAFKKLGYKRVEAAANLDNKRSMAGIKSLGMKKECIRKHFIYENGKWQDLVVFVAISKSKKCWRADEY